MGNNINWTQILNTCPEFIPNQWDLLFALIALSGFIMSILLIFRLQKFMKDSVYLLNLAGGDLGVCGLYLWTYFYASGAVYFKSDTVAQLRIDLTTETKTLKDFYEHAIVILIFHIVFEKFLWTCTSRTRHTFRLFTDANLKTYLTAGTAVYAIGVAILNSWNHVQLDEVPFCEVALLGLPIRQPFFRFTQLYVIPSVYLIAVILSFVFAMITLCRISRVGLGEKPVNQEEVELSNTRSESPILTTGRVKRSILCILAVYFLFMVRNFCWYIYVNPTTSNIAYESRNTRILRNWSYDFMSAVFSGSRMIVYYVFCRNEMVYGFPPNALQRR